MGLIRFLRRCDIGLRVNDTMLNIIEEKSFVDGIKRTVKEDLTEDNPLTKPIYKWGKYDGKFEGYEAASNEYEKKLLEQADAFLKQKKNFREERDLYEKLLDDYEKEIEILSKKLNKTEAENAFLRELLVRERRLKQMAV